MAKLKLSQIAIVLWSIRNSVRSSQNVIAFGMRNPACIGVFVIAALCYGQASAQTPPRPTATYHSDAMSMDFIYPSSFVNQGADESKNCVSTPVAAMDMSKGFNMIFLRRFDGACMGKEIVADRKSVAVNFVNDLLKMLGKPDVNKSMDYEIGGHMASTVSGTVKLSNVRPAGTVVYGAGSCAVVGKDLVCFGFLSSDCPTLAVLSASTVKFTDTAEASILPANLAPACRSGR